MMVEKIQNSSISGSFVDTKRSAPTISPEELWENIASCDYYTAYDAAKAVGVQSWNLLANHAQHEISENLERVTHCVIVLKNGYVVTGESIVDNIQNFNGELGRKLAQDNAIDKIYPLLRFAAREKN